MNIQGFLADYNIPSVLSGKNVGNGWVGVNCPFCGDTGYHGAFNLTHGGWHCWRCSTHHGSRSAIKALIKGSWSDVNHVMKKYFTGYGSVVKKESVRTIPFRYPGGNDIPPQMHDYLRMRGFDPEYIIRHYKVGWGGLDGDYALRMIIPVYFNGVLVSYQGRDITGSANIRYKDCSKKEAVIYHKNLLYNIDNCKENWCVVVEGVTDVWALGDNVCATFGIGFTQNQVSMLADFFDRVVVWFDPGTEAQGKARNLAARLGVLGVEVKLFSLDVLDAAPAELPELYRSEVIGLLSDWGRR